MCKFGILSFLASRSINISPWPGLPQWSIVLRFNKRHRASETKPKKNPSKWWIDVGCLLLQLFEMSNFHEHDSFFLDTISCTNQEFSAFSLSNGNLKFCFIRTTVVLLDTTVYYLVLSWIAQQKSNFTQWLVLAIERPIKSNGWSLGQIMWRKSDPLSMLIKVRDVHLETCQKELQKGSRLTEEEEDSRSGLVSTWYC